MTLGVLNDAKGKKNKHANIMCHVGGQKPPSLYNLRLSFPLVKVFNPETVSKPAKTLECDAPASPVEFFWILDEHFRKEGWIP